MTTHSDVDFDHQASPRSLLARIAAARTPQRRAISETLAKLKSHYFKTAYDEMVEKEISILLESIDEELGDLADEVTALGTEELEEHGVEKKEMIRGGRITIISGKAGASKTRTIQHVLRNRAARHGALLAGLELA